MLCSKVYLVIASPVMHIIFSLLRPIFLLLMNVVWNSNVCLDFVLRDLKKSLKEYTSKVATCESKMAELQRQVDSDKVKVKDGSPVREVVIHIFHHS